LPVATRRDDLAKGEQAKQEEPYRLRMSNFSLGGLCAVSTVPMKPDERLTMRLASHGNHPPLELTGRVVRCQRQEDEFCVGIEFCQTRPEATASPWHRMFRLFTMAAEPPSSGFSLERTTDA
jgi:c-di-GMP-binding flagellar brake protein YcgR